MTSTAEGIKERTRRAVKSQKQQTITVLSCLLAAHDDLGYLPDEAIEEIATYTDSTINEVWGVASFYTNFRFTPPGEHAVEVCWGPTCHLTGAAAILQGVLDSLGLQDEGETADNRVSLKYNTCLGACAQAPVMSIDHQLIGRITKESATSLIDRLGRSESKRAAAQQARF